EWVDGSELFVRFTSAVGGLGEPIPVEQVYVLQGIEAVEHLFRVASSLDSLVLGEPQILGQTKAAFRAAESERTVGPDLHRWVPRAFAVAKQVRSETSLCELAVNTSSAAVELAGKVLGPLAGKRVVLLGAGKMGELAARHLRDAGVSTLVVANRTRSRADEVA